MEAHIYKQSYEGFNIINVEPSDYFTTITCGDCNGTGVFYITDEHFEDCVLCKTKGELYVNIL